MTDRVICAAIAVVLGMSARQAAAQEAPGIIHAWPALSPWITFMMRLPDGSAVCSTATQTPPLGPAGYTVSFVLGAGRTHFYLVAHDTTVRADRLQLVGDGGPFADMAVIGQQQALETTIADIPGDDLVKRIIPEMTKDQEIVLRAGDHSFPVPHANFAQVAEQVRECAAEYQKLYSPPR